MVWIVKQSKSKTPIIVVLIAMLSYKAVAKIHSPRVWTVNLLQLNKPLFNELSGTKRVTLTVLYCSLETCLNRSCLLQQFGEDMKASDKRMTSERCAHLSFVAIVNQLEEAWLCFFPALPLIYFGQYMPTIGKRYTQPSITNLSGLRSFKL